MVQPRAEMVRTDSCAVSLYVCVGGGGGVE